MKRLLRSTAIILALGFFIPAPSPITGIVFNRAAYADPYNGTIPDWIKETCCGPKDVHRLTMANVHEVDGVEAQVFCFATKLLKAQILDLITT